MNNLYRNFIFVGRVMIALFLLGMPHVLTAGPPQLQPKINIPRMGELTPSELKRLEPVCLLVLQTRAKADLFWYEQLRNTDILDRPEYRMAKNAPFMHHYCFGKAAKLRVSGLTNSQDRRQYLERIRDEMDFCLNSAAQVYPNWPYTVVLYLEKGESYLASRQYAEAVSVLEQGLAINSNHPMIYYRLAQAYENLGMTEKALSVVVEGLKVVPGFGLLEKYFSELGEGNEYPEPYSSADGEKAMDGKRDENESASGENRGGGTKKDPEGGTQRIEISSEAAVPKESFCRFCPESGGR